MLMYENLCAETSIRYGYAHRMTEQSRCNPNVQPAYYACLECICMRMCHSGSFLQIKSECISCIVNVHALFIAERDSETKACK